MHIAPVVLQVENGKTWRHGLKLIVTEALFHSDIAISLIQ